MTRAVLALLLAVCLPAGAQTLFSAGITSDYRVRGVSYSGGLPSAWASVNHDFDSGWYAGASAARARLRGDGHSVLAQAYAGYAARIGSSLSWEAGASRTFFDGSGEYDYGEAFAGLVWERVGVRAYYAPHYYGVGGQAWYLEANGSWPLAADWDLAVHVGRLQMGDMYYYGYRKEGARDDVRIGVARNWDAWSAQLAWTRAGTGGALYGAAAVTPRRAWVLGVSRTF
ncbi:MAG: TorF family putative porin [Telluria sp.]